MTRRNAFSCRRKYDLLLDLCYFPSSYFPSMHMHLKRIALLYSAMLILAFCAAASQADPCGMVPPISLPNNEHGIERTGLQQTYAFYKNGIETLVIHPGFHGKVAEFGMLIPFPTPPAIRKVPDTTFAHIQAAIDPPEVIVDTRPSSFGMPGGYGGGMYGGMGMGMGGMGGEGGGYGLQIAKDETRVLKEEAVGMYDVVVLQAGSSRALERWMTENSYRYPAGMGEVCEEYIADKWCFVAVRARIGHKGLVDPRPGQKQVDDRLQPGASFDGHVQAMGFRFHASKLVIPMRLSTFNEGDLRNIVYVLADAPLAINHIDRQFVVRQLAGENLFTNLSAPLPVRFYGSKNDIRQIPKIQRDILKSQRESRAAMRSAIELFQSDLDCANNKRISNEPEELEKNLNTISERLGLRGDAIDSIVRNAVSERVATFPKELPQELKNMTLTVLDGDFPREILSKENLFFVPYKMPTSRNSSKHYHAVQHGPVEEPKGSLRLENELSLLQLVPHNSSVESYAKVTQPEEPTGIKAAAQPAFSSGANIRTTTGTAVPSALGTLLRTLLLLLFAMLTASIAWKYQFRLIGVVRRRVMNLAKGLLIAALATGVASATLGQAKSSNAQLDELIADLAKPEAAASAAKQLIAMRNPSIKSLSTLERNAPVEQVGWAIVCLAEIGTPQANAVIKRMAASENAPIVRTWLAAASLKTVPTMEAMLKHVDRNRITPELERPFRQRVDELLGDEAHSRRAEKLVKLSLLKPDLSRLLGRWIAETPPSELAAVCYQSKSAQVRRTAAGYLAGMAQQDPSTISAAIVHALRYDADRQTAPWEGGPLFIPQISWSVQEAVDLIFQLARWQMWAERNENSEMQKQLANNLRDLSRVVGASPSTVTGTACLKSIEIHLDLSQYALAAAEHGIEISPAIWTSIRGEDKPRKAYLARKDGMVTTYSASERGYGGGGYGGGGYGGGDQTHVEVCWRIREDAEESTIVQLRPSGGLKTNRVPSSWVHPIDDLDSLSELASNNGKYSVLLHRINAPKDRDFLGLFSDRGKNGKSQTYAGLEQIESGYWVYVFPTWFVWKNSN